MSTFIVTNEMAAFRKLLTASDIRWIDDSSLSKYPYDGMWICRTHFNIDGTNWSVIHGYGSIGGFTGAFEKSTEGMKFYSGHDDGLLEVYDFSNDPVGFLTAKDCACHINKMLGKRGLTKRIVLNT